MSLNNNSNKNHHHYHSLWNIYCSTIKSILFILFSHYLVIIHAKPNRPLLRGVTFRNWPYADRINDRYEGFVVDFMNLIAQKVGFEYRLYFSPDGKYGTEFNGHINGMIGEVYRNRADFAIADLTVTESRKRYVDFTDAFIENQLAAIIRRDDAVGLRTLEDLVTLNEINHRPDLPPTERRGLLTYGTYRTGATYYHLSRSRDPIAKKIYEWMERNPDALVTSAKEGFDRVNAGRYAFIVESTFAEYLTGIYCNLTMLYDARSLYPRRFAIALPKGSPYIHSFNKAIRELKESGIIQRLRHKYWINRCNHFANNNNNADILSSHHLLIPSPTPATVQQQQQPQPSQASINSTQVKNKDDQLISFQNNYNNADDNPNRNSNNNNSNNNNNNNNSNNNNNNNDNNTNNGRNSLANNVKIEWASHNHHSHHHNHQQSQSQQPPPPAPPIQASYPIDRNRNPIIHHRINHYQHNHNNNKMAHNHQDYGESAEQFFGKNIRNHKRINQQSDRSAAFTSLATSTVMLFGCLFTSISLFMFQHNYHS